MKKNLPQGKKKEKIDNYTSPSGVYSRDESHIIPNRPICNNFFNQNVIKYKKGFYPFRNLSPISQRLNNLGNNLTFQRKFSAN